MNARERLVENSWAQMARFVRDLTGEGQQRRQLRPRCFSEEESAYKPPREQGGSVWQAQLPIATGHNYSFLASELKRYSARPVDDCHMGRTVISRDGNAVEVRTAVLEQEDSVAV